MKLKELISKLDQDELSYCNIYYDEQITKGLYVVSKEHFVMRNAKNLSIKFQISDSKDKLGVRFTKNVSFVMITIAIIDENSNKHYIQFIVKKECTPEYIRNCKHYILQDIESIIISGLDLLKAETLADAMKWTDQMEGNNKPKQK